MLKEEEEKLKNMTNRAGLRLKTTKPESWNCQDDKDPTFWSRHDQFTLNGLANRARDTEVEDFDSNKFLPDGVLIIRRHAREAGGCG